MDQLLWSPMKVTTFTSNKIQNLKAAFSSAALLLPNKFVCPEGILFTGFLGKARLAGFVQIVTFARKLKSD